jgi:hypothetical protein
MSEEVNRVVKLEDGTEIYIRDPDRACRERAETEKTRAWYKALNDGCLSEKQIIKLLKEKGIWDQEKEAELTLMQKELFLCLDRLEEGGYFAEEAKKDAVRAHKLRSDIQSLIYERTQHLSHSLESKVRNVEFEYLVSWCPVYNTDRNTPYFTDYADYLNKQETDDAITIASKCAELFYGLSDFDDTPEKVFLKTHKFVDENFRLINEDGHLVDVNGKLINEDGNYIKYEGEGEDRKAILVDFDGNSLVKKEKKPFLDKDGNPIIQSE